MMTFKLYTYLFCLFIIYSCSEGDIINDTKIDYEGVLENCSNEDDNTFVFYKTTNNPNRSLSVSFTSTTFDITPSSENISVTEPIEILLNTTTNKLIYREFNKSIVGSDYFCNSIPPSGITITDQFASTNGTIEITYVQDVDNLNIYDRTVTLRDITLEGNGLIIRREVFVLGTDRITITD